MKRFHYEARDKSTQRLVKATVRAESEPAAVKLVVNSGLLPVKIWEEVDDSKGVGAFLFNRITMADRVIFTRQLATLITAGLPLAEGLRTVADQTKNPRLQSVVEEVIASVEGGESLADAMRQFPKVFDHIFVALVSAGEASGTLDVSLRRLADQYEKDAATIRKIRGALVYPAMVLIVILFVVVFMLFTVIPSVEALYESIDKPLPFATLLLVGAANYLVEYWFFIVLIVGVIAYFLIQYFRTEAGIALKDRWKLRMPIFGVLFQKLYMGRLTRTGESLLSAGVPMLETLRLAGDAINNTSVKQSVDRAAEKVKGGKSLSNALRAEDTILLLVPQMIRIGEQSGKIDEMMGKAATIYEDEIDETVHSISTLIEPILMVVMAIFAGGMVAAILFPIYNLVNDIQL